MSFFQPLQTQDIQDTSCVVQWLKSDEKTLQWVHRQKQEHYFNGEGIQHFFKLPVPSSPRKSQIWIYFMGLTRTGSKGKYPTWVLKMENLTET